MEVIYGKEDVRKKERNASVLGITDPTSSYIIIFAELFFHLPLTKK